LCDSALSVCQLSLPKPTLWCGGTQVAAWQVENSWGEKGYVARPKKKCVMPCRVRDDVLIVV